MKINNIKDINTFLNTVTECEDNVTLTSVYGDRFNLKSTLSQYIAVAALLGEHGEELELWCDSKEDEYKFLKMFSDNPSMR